MRQYGVFHEKFSVILFLVVALVSVGQLTNTIYVPAMAMIAHDMHIHPERVEMLIGGYLLTYGLSQFIYGPLSDLYGRRPIIIVGLIIFAIGSFLATLATTFNALLYGCLIQGLGTGVCGVMARTVMRDCYTDQKLHKANSYISIAIILAPLLAPILGGFISVHFGWRADFVFLLVFGALILGVEYYLFPETNLKVKQQCRDFNRILTAYRAVLLHKVFWGYSICLIATFAAVSVFEAGASVLFTKVLHYPLHMVSWLFILPIPGYLLGSYSAAYLSELMSIPRLMWIAILIACLSTVVFCAFAFAHVVNLFVILAPITVYFFSAGLMFPTATTGALNPLGDYAGTAGAVLGGMQNLGAALLTFMFSFITQTSQRPLGLILIAVAIVLVSTYWLMMTARKAA